MTLSLGIDIGGTKTAYAVVDAYGNVLATHHHATPVTDGFDAVAVQLAAIAGKMIDAYPRVMGIGVGCPGYVDSDSGVVVAARNLTWQQAPLRDALTAKLGNLPIFIENDVKALALGEMHFVVPDARDLLFVALGTGLSGAVIANGNLVHGSGSVATEIGQVRIPPGWHYTGEGTRLEDVISGNGIVRIASWFRKQENAPTTTLPACTDAKAILQAARAGDELAEKSMTVLVEWFNEILLWVAAALNPSAIVIAGGFGIAASPWIIPALQAHLAGMAEHLKPDIMVSQLINPAVGAAALPLQYLAK